MKDVQALFREGKVHEADQLAQKYQAAHPDNPEIRFARAMIHQSVKAWPTAIELVGQAARMDSNNERYLVMLGNLLVESGRLESAEAAMRAALKRLPHSPALAMALGSALLLQNKLVEAEECFEALVRRFPDDIPARSNLARCWLRKREFDKAIDLFTTVCKLQPHVAELNQNVVRALCDAERFDEANEFLRAWVGRMPSSFEAWNAAARFYEEIYRPADALEACERAIACSPDRPEGLILKARLIAFKGLREEGLQWVRRGLLLQPQNADGHVVLASLLSQDDLWDEALYHADRAAEFAPNDAKVLHRVGNIHKSAAKFSKSNFAAASRFFSRSVAINPSDEDAVGDLCVIRRQMADWSDLADLERKVLDFNRSFFSWPFDMLSMEQATRADQLLAGRHFMSGIKRTLEQHGWAPLALPERGSSGRPERLRIGYLSADFRTHPVSVLAAELFESHDRARYETFAYAAGVDVSDPLRERVKEAFEHFGVIGEDVDTLQLAERIRADGIHILVDLGGYTASNRAGVLALRAAPVQVMYLGYPGTSGADFVDYMITDPVAAPPEHAQDYSEKLAYVSGSYLPNDSHRMISPGATRAAHGLPDDAFVFVCFNQLYKVTEAVFDTWARILESVPGSVLWLSADRVEARANIEREAAKRGLAPGRLIFAQRVDDASRHLGRLALADLALDTRPYNMHATGCDVLWAGVPLITVPGETLASRVGASLLTALGMPELIAPDLDAYRELAVGLATDHARYAAVRDKLARRRTESGLFDGRQSACDVESLFDQMWDRYALGLAPDHLRSTVAGPGRHGEPANS